MAGPCGSIRPLVSEPSLRVRFAPSPTGALHIGGARTALYNWLAARHEGGELVLRIEDTDRERSTAANVDQILDALQWLELWWDEGPISQAERAPRHAAALERLLESGHAYRDSATAKDVEAWKAEHGAGSGYRGTPSDGAGRGGAAAGARRGGDGGRGPDPRPGRLPQRQLRRLRHRPRRRQRPLQLRRRRRRRRDGDHRRGPRRRPPLEHAEAAAGAGGARLPGAALRPPAAAARPRRQEALQAPRRRLGPGAARGRLPAGGGPQLPGAARLGHRRRHDDPLDRGAGAALPRRRRRQIGGDLRREEAALAERAGDARALAGRLHRRRRRPPRPPAPTSACAPPARSPRRKRRRWPRSGR